MIKNILKEERVHGSMKKLNAITNIFFKRKHIVSCLVSLLAVTILVSSLVVWNRRTNNYAVSAIPYVIYTEDIKPGKLISDIWFRGEKNNPFAEDMSNIVWYKSNDDFATRTEITDSSETISDGYKYQVEMTWTLNFVDPSKLSIRGISIKDLYSDKEYSQIVDEKDEPDFDTNNWYEIDTTDNEIVKLRFTISDFVSEKELKLFYANSDVQRREDYQALDDAAKLSEQAKLEEVTDYQNFFKKGLDVSRVLIGLDKSDALEFSDYSPSTSENLKNSDAIQLIYNYKLSDPNDPTQYVYAPIQKGDVIKFYGKKLYLESFDALSVDNDYLDVKHYNENSELAIKVSSMSIDLSFNFEDRPVMESVKGDPIHNGDNFLTVNMTGKNLEPTALLIEIPSGVTADEIISNWAFYTKVIGITPITATSLDMVNHPEIHEPYLLPKTDKAVYEFEPDYMPDAGTSYLVYQMSFSESYKLGYVGEPVTITFEQDTPGDQIIHIRELKNDTDFENWQAAIDEEGMPLFTINNNNENVYLLFSKELTEAYNNLPDDYESFKPFKKGSKFNVLLSCLSNEEPTSLKITSSGSSDFKDVTPEYNEEFFDRISSLMISNPWGDYDEVTDENLDIVSTAFEPYINKWTYKEVMSGTYAIYAYATLEFPDDVPTGGGSSRRRKKTSTPKEVITIPTKSDRTVDKVVVLDKNGREVEVTLTDGVYSYIKQNSECEVNVSYKPRNIKLTIDSLIAKVDNEDVRLDTVPVVENNRTMLPIRFIAENTECEVSWDEPNKKVTIRNEEKDIDVIIWIGKDKALVNGKEVELDSPAYINKETSRTYLPIRFVAENLGSKVTWDESQNLVDINYEFE